MTEEQQRRYTDANALPMLEPDEMPGALPETLPSPDQDANIGRCWTCRSMFMQAWGQYGIAWPVIHQQLGVRPSLGTGKLEIVPQIPEGQKRIGGKDIRLGDGAAAVEASVSGSRYTTTTTVEADRGRDRRARRRDAPRRRGGAARSRSTASGEEADRARDQPRRRGDREGPGDGKARGSRAFIAGTATPSRDLGRTHMRWRRTLTLSALLAAVPAVAQAQTELSVGDRLQDRREVAAGTRAYSVGFQDGRFYANGWHITGEMGGIWAPPLKLADGVWFGVDDAWVGRPRSSRPAAGTSAMTCPTRPA